MEAYLLDWANLLVRWLHFIAGVAWIGASFYFVMLYNSLSKPARRQDEERGVSGELWAVHGGGVYQSQNIMRCCHARAAIAGDRRRCRNAELRKSVSQFASLFEPSG